MSIWMTLLSAPLVSLTGVWSQRRGSQVLSAIIPKLTSAVHARIEMSKIWRILRITVSTNGDSRFDSWAGSRVFSRGSFERDCVLVAMGVVAVDLLRTRVESIVGLVGISSKGVGRSVRS
jgi:hypothetical protein